MNLLDDRIDRYEGIGSTIKEWGMATDGTSADRRRTTYSVFLRE